MSPNVMRRVLQCLLLGIALSAPAHLHARTLLLKTQPGSVVHWSQATISVAIDVSARSRTVSSDNANRALEMAVQAWNAIKAEQPRLGLTTDTSPDVSIRFCRGRWQGDTIDLGRSKFVASLRDGTVSKATVEINECDHGFSGPEQRTGYDLQAVLTHELGHVLGLGHSDNTSAIMYPSGGGTSVRVPHLEDQTTLALIYLGRASTGPSSPLASIPAERDAVSSTHASVNASLLSGHIWDAMSVHLDAIATSPYETSPQIPADSVSVLSFKTRRGRNVMVYTCEPTLLPPIENAPVDRQTSGPSARQARKSGHNPAP
jgi:predicted Zn-dependent protease